jgi:primosomal protein N' (replication factor Y)
VLYLLPEIAVTNALTDRLQSAFGNRLLVYHSAITNAKRAGIWNRLLDPSEEPLVVLGARSSLFLPFARLGLVIVDDEHDTSYKQQDPAPRYHARNAALVLARLHKAKTLLCSATPSLESYVHATNGKYGLVKMPHTATQQPQIEIIDVRDLRRKNRMRGETLFSPQLIEYIRSVLDNGLKVILFQNRRGASDTFTYYGFGSEDIEREVHSLFPAVATVRLDTDTAHTRKAAERLLSDFVGGKASILVGTQLVAKRRNYGGVGLVAVMNLDTILNVQDFRAYERAFDMVFLLSALTDATIPRPKIVLQTAQADNPAFPALRSLDYDAMARSQLAERHAFAYPPYSRLITVILKAKSEQLLDTFAEEYAECLRTVFGDAVSEPSTPTNSTSYSRQSFFVRRIKLKTDITSPVATIRRSLESCYDRMRLTPFAGRIILHYDVDN